jgi:dimethylamine/trimethylamine dehydrogenase
MGEEWRKGWHPERIQPKKTEAPVLIVGGGPSGLECALALARRGYEVTLADAQKELGGRVLHEARLPGLATWGRVASHRLLALRVMSNVELYEESELNADAILDYGFSRVVLATGATWRRDGFGRHHTAPLSISDDAVVLTPDDLFAAERPPSGQVVIYDDDHYYLGSVVAELLRKEGYDVLFVTPEAQVSSWSAATLEQRWVEERLYELGIEVITKHAVTAIGSGTVTLEHAVHPERTEVPCGSVILITARLPNETLYRNLKARSADRADAGLTTVLRIGDCLAPSTIAAAVYAGHRCARELDEPPSGDVAFSRQIHGLEQVDP